MGDSHNPGTLGDVLIPIINKLQDIFSQVTVDLKLDLPQVAVVGSQSSGKSSVLEALVGKDFLPRGNEIVTRRPLVLQLVKSTAPQGGRSSEWAEFLHAPGKMYYDFDRVRQEIQQETERLVGVNKAVSDKPIRLKVHSPRVLTMTLVDLPGLTRIPVGDQPSNIEQRIREMVLEYIRRPNCIILAVTPATVDLATSDALQLAAEADPEGDRTIGVLTKLDLMDRGTDASHVLRNTHIPLRMGYFGVVLRSQQDIQQNKPMAVSRKAEETFFSDHAEYRDVAQQCGVANLARRLNASLVGHIRGKLPDLRRRIGEALEARIHELRSLGDPEPNQGKSERGAFLLRLLCHYAERYTDMLEGRHLNHSMVAHLTGGARVREVYTAQFLPALQRLDPSRELSDNDVYNVIRNGSGVLGTLLVAQESFELLARRAIEQLLEPSLLCCERVHQELAKIAEQACPPQVARFPYLQRQLAATVSALLRSGADPASQMLHSLVECESDYINTDHPDFIGGRGGLRSFLLDRSSRQGPAAAAGLGAPGGERGGRRDAEAATANGSVPAGRSGRGSVAEVRGGTPTTSIGLKGLPDSPQLSEDIILQPGGLGSNARRADTDLALSDSASLHLGGGGGAAGPGGSDRPGWWSWFTPSASSSSLTGPGVMMGGMGRSSDDAPLGYRGRPARGPPRLSEEELAEVDMVRKLVESYFGIVRKTLADQVPKVIMHYLVNYSKKNLQQYLIRSLYKDDLLEDLLMEADGVVARRAAVRETVDVLRRAQAALEELPSELSEQLFCTTPPSEDEASERPIISVSNTRLASPREALYSGRALHHTLPPAPSHHTSPPPPPLALHAPRSG